MGQAERDRRRVERLDIERQSMEDKARKEKSLSRPPDPAEALNHLEPDVKWGERAMYTFTEQNKRWIVKINFVYSCAGLIVKQLEHLLSQFANFGRAFVCAPALSVLCHNNNI